MKKALTIGVIGLGSIGERHIRNLRARYPHSSIDILTKRTTWKGADTKTTLYTSTRTFFARPHDVYFITNETAKHAQTTLQCLAQKPRGIFIEKPLSHTLTGLTKIQALAKKQGTIVVVGYNLQFFTPLVEIKKMLKKQTLGKILSMRVSVGQDLRTWRAGDYRTSYSSDPKRGGGVVLDLIHDLNYPAWLLDEELHFIAGVSGRVSNLKIKSEDIAESIFRSTKGTLVTLHQDYLQIPGKRTCEIVGEKGTLLWEWPLTEGSDSYLHMSTRGATKSSTIVEKDKNVMYLNEVESFMRHVSRGDEYTNLMSAIADTKNALKIRASHL